MKIIDVKDCAACGFDHENILKINDLAFMCPKTSKYVFCGTPFPTYTSPEERRSEAIEKLKKYLEQEAPYDESIRRVIEKMEELGL